MSTDKARWSRSWSWSYPKWAWVSCMVGATVGCVGGQQNTREPERTTVTVLYPGDERILGPYWEMPAKFLVFEPLVTTDEKGEIIAALAERWEHSEDYRNWTVHLRTDVRWHDGVPFTARDVAFTFELWSHPTVARLAPGSKRIEVLDDSTFVLELTRPISALSTWDVYYPAHVLEDLDPAEFAEWPFWVQPIGTGPFRYLRHVDKTLIELEANHDDYRGGPDIDRLVLLFGSPEVTELLAGNVDVMHYASHSTIPALRADPRFEIYHHVWPDASWIEAIYWNHREPYFADSPVRHALTLALNRAELRTFLEVPGDLPVVDVLYSGRQFRQNELPEPLPYDPQEARGVLEAAGWQDTDGDGIRERAGVALAFTALVPHEGAIEGATLQKAAVYAQEALQRVGARMEVQVLESNLVRRRLRAGDFQAVFYRFYNQIHEGEPWPWWGQDGWTGYENSRVDELLDSLAMTADPERRDVYFRALMPIFQRDVPVTFLFPQSQTIVAHRRLRGLESPFASNPVIFARNLWLDGQP